MLSMTAKTGIIILIFIVFIVIFAANPNMIVHNIILHPVVIANDTFSIFSMFSTQNQILITRLDNIKIETNQYHQMKAKVNSIINEFRNKKDDLINMNRNTIGENDKLKQLQLQYNNLINEYNIKRTELNVVSNELHNTTNALNNAYHGCDDTILELNTHKMNLYSIKNDIDSKNDQLNKTIEQIQQARRQLDSFNTSILLTNSNTNINSTTTGYTTNATNSKNTRNGTARVSQITSPERGRAFHTPPKTRNKNKIYGSITGFSDVSGVSCVSGMTTHTIDSIGTGNINSGNRICNMSGMSGISGMVINNHAMEDGKSAKKFVTPSTPSKMCNNCE